MKNRFSVLLISLVILINSFGYTWVSAIDDRDWSVNASQFTADNAEENSALPSVVDGVTCAYFYGSNYLYINAFIDNNTRAISINFWYYDETITPLKLQYRATVNNASGYKEISLSRTGTNSWMSANITLKDAQFDNGLTNIRNFSYDFRITSTSKFAIGKIGMLEIPEEDDIDYWVDTGKFAESSVAGSVINSTVDFVNCKKITAGQKLAYRVTNAPYPTKYVKIKMYYYDNGIENISFRYNSITGAKLVSIGRVDSKAWKEKEFFINDANFNNSLSFAPSNYSFALESNGVTGTDDVHIGRFDIDYIDYQYDVTRFLEKYEGTTVVQSTIDSVNCKQINAGNTIGYSIQNNSFWMTDNMAVIRFYYYDNGTLPIKFRYRSLSPLAGQTYDEVSIIRTNSNTWKEFQATLNDVRFDNSLSFGAGAYSYGIYSEGLFYIGNIKVAKPEIAYVNPYAIHSVTVQNNQIDVVPAVRQDIITNPGMGYQSKDPQIGNGPEAKVAYKRFYWKEIEPNDGIYNYEPIDTFIEEAKAKGQDAAFRIMPYGRPDYENDGSTSSFSKCEPAWFRQSHTGTVFTFSQYKQQIDPAFPQNGYAFEPNAPIWVIDWGAEDFITQQEQLITAIGDRYNNHPDIAFVDVWGPGNWGEWHNAVGLPSDPNQSKRIINKFIGKLSNITKVISIQSAVRLESQSLYPGGINTPYVLQYALSQGIGWRYDGMEYSTINQIDDLLAGIGAQDSWKNAPVYFEPGGWDPNTRIAIYNASNIAQYKNLHITGFQNFNDVIADNYVDEFVDLAKSAGYRLILNQLSVPVATKACGTMPITMEFENVGLNPPYKKDVLAIRLSTADEEYVFETEEDITKWLPGVHEINRSITLPNSVAPGEYMLSVGILDQYYKVPEIKLANQGRDSVGWYPMCKVVIDEKPIFEIDSSFTVGENQDASQLSPGQILRAVANVTNNGGEDAQGIQLIVALYNGNGKLVDVVTKNGVVEKGESLELISNPILLPAPLNGHYTKMFIWKRANAGEIFIQPICPVTGIGSPIN